MGALWGGMDGLERRWSAVSARVPVCLFSQPCAPSARHSCTPTVMGLSFGLVYLIHVCDRPDFALLLLLCACVNSLTLLSLPMAP